MSLSRQFSHQRGVALFVGLILLLMLTVIGVAGFHNSHIQERSAGNTRLQAIALEAAAAGAASAIDFFDEHRDSGPDQECGDLDHEGWDEATDWVEVESIGDASLKQRMYCIADSYPCSEDDDESCDEDERPARSQLFVLSRGEVILGSGDNEMVVAQRDVEVRLDLAYLSAAGDGCGALCFPSCIPGDFEFPNSNSFQVDGGGGPAITGGCDAMTEEIRDAVRDRRIGNYVGGIHTTAPGSPWDDPDSVESFRENVMQAAIEAQSAGTCMELCYYSGDYSDNGNAQYGNSANPQITYIHGDASFGGNVSGAGILFVNGTLSWNGTPNFQGLIVTLGGMLSINGGGHGGDHGGSVVILNAPGGQPAVQFGESGFENTGGGNALYRFDCGALWVAHGLLDDQGQGLWNPECETGPQNPFEAGVDELIIASWRENIGWREEFFGSEE